MNQVCKIAPKFHCLKLQVNWYTLYKFLNLKIQITNSQCYKIPNNVLNYKGISSSSSFLQAFQVTLRQFSLSSNLLVHVNKRRELVSKNSCWNKNGKFQRNLYIFIIRDWKEESEIRGATFRSCLVHCKSQSLIGSQRTK